ncbi:MAG: acetyl-CoA hydrolase/transferase C-terminal domain-containing protein [Dehalococcoidia bacterium]|nr:acetyl-CoA hydrolase/transferase C-terminal domain-containing protein [Dehalococcoidia bacterium]
MSWQEEYKKKTITAEAAAALVKDGDFISIPMGREPVTFNYALQARVGDVRGVKICPAMQARDFVWYEPGVEEFFMIEAPYAMPTIHKLFELGIADFLIPDVLMRRDFNIDQIQGSLDILVVTVSPPDKHGYVSFGGSVWFKHSEMALAKIVIAEVNPNQIRTYGQNAAHVSEFDYFVEHIDLGTPPQTRDMTGRMIGGPGEAEKKIAEYVHSLTRDGDCIMVGIGGSTEFLFDLGAYKGRSDLGIHTEIISPGLIKGVKSGQITGARKKLHKGVAIGTAVGGGRAEYDFVDMNPQFELYPAEYCLDPRIIAEHENMTVFASCFAIDFTGQGITDGIGYTMKAGTGGQASFAIGAGLAKGGRYVLAFNSTTSDGRSKIVAAFEPGSVVSIPRWLTDIVVTENGIARVKGKSQRYRADAFIALAHPDHRAELTKKARAAFWPKN